MTGIVAVSKNNIIGNHGKIPWKVKEDMNWFKQLTERKTIIVGYNTYEKMPRLKNRKMLVLSNNRKESLYDPFYDFSMSTISYDDIFTLPNHDKFIVCGGNQTYKTMVNRISTLYVTRIDLEVEGDVEFDLDLEQHFKEPYFYRKLSDRAHVYVYTNKFAL